MERKLEDKTLYLDFTPEELTRYIIDYQNPRAHSRTYDNPAYCWYSWDDMLRYLREGWEEGVQETDVKIGSIETGVGEAPKTALETGVTGDFFDIGKVLTGEPECWYSVVQEDQPREELTIVVNLGYSCNVKQDAVFMRGAVIAKVIDELRRRYFVKLLLVNRNEYGAEAKYINNRPFNYLECKITVDTQNHYSRSLVAFLVACPAVIRRLHFGMLEKETGKNSCSSGGYGVPHNVSGRHENDLIFPMITPYNQKEYSSIKSAKRKVESILKQYEKK